MTARSDLYHYICDLFEERIGDATYDEINALLDAFAAEAGTVWVVETSEAGNPTYPFFSEKDALEYRRRLESWTVLKGRVVRCTPDGKREVVE